MQSLEVIGEVRHIYVVRRQRVKEIQTLLFSHSDVDLS
jgi:hypothetical protein